jgi:hypothetical protein
MITLFTVGYLPTHWLLKGWHRRAPTASPAPAVHDLAA